MTAADTPTPPSELAEPGAFTVGYVPGVMPGKWFDRWRERRMHPVLENALVTMSHEARERAFAQVDELLAEYSQYPFARRPGGSQAIGANLAQAINDEVNKNPERELQMEVCFLRLFLMR